MKFKSMSKTELANYNSKHNDEPCRKEALFEQNHIDGFIGDEYFEIAKQNTISAALSPKNDFNEDIQYLRQELIKYGFLIEKS